MATTAPSLEALPYDPHVPPTPEVQLQLNAEDAKEQWKESRVYDDGEESIMTASLPLETSPSHLGTLPKGEANENVLTPDAPRLLQYNTNDVARVTRLQEHLGVPVAHLAEQWGISRSHLHIRFNGKHTHCPGVMEAGKKAMQWCEEHKNAPAPTPYSSDDSQKVAALLERVQMTRAQVAEEHGCSPRSLEKWLEGKFTHYRGDMEAGRSAMQWYNVNKDKPSASNALPDNAQTAAKVSALLTRLEMTQAALIVQSGLPLSKRHLLSQWLHGKNTRQPAVAAIGETSLQWYEEHKDTPTPCEASQRQARCE